MNGRYFHRHWKTIGDIYRKEEQIIIALIASKHLVHSLLSGGVETLVVLNTALAGSLLLNVSQRHVPVVCVDVLDVLERDGRNEAL